MEKNPEKDQQNNENNAHPESKSEVLLTFSDLNFEASDSKAEMNYQRKLKREEKALQIHNNKRTMTKERTKKKNQEKKEERRELFKTFTKQEEFSEYFAGEKQSKIDNRNNAKKGLENGLKILIDDSYGDDMNKKERNSLAMQICICFGWMKRLPNPVSLNIVNCKEKTDELLKKMGLNNWALNIYHEDILEIEDFKSRKSDLIYLSPDSEDLLESIEKDKIYIIGGLVDRTIRKFASLKRARELGIRTGKLPINKFMGLTRRKPLNIDTVVLLLADVLETKDWEKSFLKVCPKRLLLEEFKGHKEEEKVDESAEEEEKNGDKVEEHEENRERFEESKIE